METFRDLRSSCLSGTALRRVLQSTLMIKNTNLLNSLVYRASTGLLLLLIVYTKTYWFQRVYINYFSWNY